MVQVGVGVLDGVYDMVGIKVTVHVAVAVGVGVAIGVTVSVGVKNGPNAATGMVRDFRQAPNERTVVDTAAKTIR